MTNRGSPDPAAGVLNEELTDRIRDGGQSIRHPELFKNIMCVITNGRRADVQPLCDRAIRRPGGQESQYLDLTTSQTVDWVVRGWRAGKTTLDERKHIPH